MKLVLSVSITVLYLSLVIGHWSLVHATYVLPYPSYMPGNKLYKVSRMVDALKKHWYFGNIAKTKYYLALSDKYLVEAKTLFEYKQYVLALDALNRSNTYSQLLHLLILKSKQENKDISLMMPIIREYILVHDLTLNTLRSQLPTEMLWQPEKQSSVLLPLHELLGKAIEIRKNISQFNQL